MLKPEALAKAVMESDDAFAWVMVLDERGEALAHVYSQYKGGGVKIREKTKERLGALDAIFLQSFSQAEKWYGAMEFILLAYGRTKILLMYSKRRKIYLAAKISRSAMAELLFRKVRALLK
ncbi:MAG: hypothetical protein HY296_05620 [Thaumarchaeota archaeon]|nr:hypothetical protein [Nitrososphaerota archaeon]